MEPIINPWIFYFMSLADGFRAAGYTLAILGFAVGIVSILAYGMENDEFMPWKYLKWFVIAFVGINGLVEAGVNIVIGAAVSKVIAVNFKKKYK